MVWEPRRQHLRQVQGESVSIAADGHALTVAEVLAGWCGDEAFRAFFITELAGTAYRAFFWELPPLTKETLSRPFECAVIAGGSLARMHADASSFSEYLDDTDLAGTVAVFPNLGGDALLIAPRRISDVGCYAHIASFLRGAPEVQKHELFQVLAHEAEQMLETMRTKFWISTSGLGVPWVHVRLDSYPKYYQYRRYADSR